MLKFDVSDELALLLCFTADVSIAIRMYSSYNKSDHERKQYAADDVMWLSDCLHNFGELGEAVRSGDGARIIHKCDELISIYKSYSVVRSTDVCPSPISFERNAKYFSLQDGIDIFESIRRKVDEKMGVSFSS